jgi:hypothetical protein
MFNDLSVWPGHSGILLSPGDGESKIRLRLASRISNEAIFDPLRRPCRKLARESRLADHITP